MNRAGKPDSSCAYFSPVTSSPGESRPGFLTSEVSTTSKNHNWSTSKTTHLYNPQLGC